jgi:hypothetical protein
MNSASPIPIGARNVAFVFSAARSRLRHATSARGQCARRGGAHGEHEHAREEHLDEQPARDGRTRRERRAHVQRPCAFVSLSPPGSPPVGNAPGRMACTIAAPVMPPRTCANVRSTARSGVSAPTSAIPRETAGLNSPPAPRYHQYRDKVRAGRGRASDAPETRKKTHAFTASEKPNESAMYSLRVTRQKRHHVGAAWAARTGWTCSRRSPASRPGPRSSSR